MPELPEIEVLKRSLEPVLVGERVEGVEVRNGALRDPVDVRKLRRYCSRRRVCAVRRRAKYLLVDLEHESTLIVHLGMSGRLTLVPATTSVDPHEHVTFRLSSGRRLRLCDPRRFGLIFALPTPKVETDRHFAHLGIEPLESGFSGDVLKRLAEPRRGPVKSFLMDGRVVVGIGNIYACEALFRARVHPQRSVARISTERWRLLGDSIQEVLRNAIRAGGTTIRDYVDGRGDQGDFQVALSVYGREGEGCSFCGRTILRKVIAGRGTFYCPGCQH